MPSFCVVSNCELKYHHADNVSFHKFPYNSPEILAKWIKFTDRGPEWKPSRWSAICSRHFLPSDFRNMISRKFLKKDAVPSITIKPFTGNFLEIHGTHSGEQMELKLADGMNLQITTEEPIEWNCRLCGISSKVTETFATNFEIYGMIQKCFPALNFQQDDELPKNICPTCLDRLHVFSDFVDIVLRTQKDLENKFQNRHDETTTTHTEKTLKIKQEPVIKVKQEVNESLHSTTSDDAENDANDEDSEIEQKSQIQNNLPIINSAEIINNCDIMEIITLDDAYIDIPDDEAVEEGPSPSQSLESCVNTGEHNYAKAQIIANQVLTVPSYKLETNEEHDVDLQIISEPKIIVIDDSIVNSVPSIPAYQCDLCAVVFLDETTLTEHKNLYHTPAVRKCIPCNLEFDSFYKFLTHKNKFHKETAKRMRKKKTNLICAMCEKAFTSKLALNNHRKYICDYPYVQEEYACKHCGKQFKRWILLRRHEKGCVTMLAKTVVSENQDCQQLLPPPPPPTAIFATLTTTPPIESQLKINANDKGQFVCSICDRIYSRRHNLYKHQITHRPPSYWNHKCGDCSKLFDHIYDLRRHLKSKACLRNDQSEYQDDQKPPNQQQQPPNQQQPQPLFFICTICGKQLKTLQRLKQHSISHSGKKPYVCESCGKSFANVNNLHQHHVTHTDVRRYKCDLCEKVFKRRGGLNQHKRAYHFKIKPHECPTCKHRYALKGDMIRCKHSLLRQ